MATYLRNWVESSKDLPAELVRCFKLMQELDQRSNALQQQVNEAAELQLEKVTASATSHIQIAWSMCGTRIGFKNAGLPMPLESRCAV